MEDSVTTYRKVYEKHPLLAIKLLKWLRNMDLSRDLFDQSLNYILWTCLLLDETKMLIKNITFYKEQFKDVSIDTRITQNIYSQWYLADPFRNIFPLVYSDIYDKYHIYSRYLWSYKNMLSNYTFINDPLNHEELVNDNAANIVIYEYCKYKKQIDVDIRKDARVYFLLTAYENLPSHNEFKKQGVIADQVDIDHIITTVPYFLTRLWLDLLYEDISLMENPILMNTVASNYRDQLWIDKSIYEKKDYQHEIANINIAWLYHNFYQKDNKYIEYLQKIIDEYVIYLYLKDLRYTVDYSK